MMRFICLWVFVFCISGCAFCGNPDREFERAMINGAKVSIGIRVADDDGVPVDKAKVHVLLGMNFREKANFIDGFTSTNGEFQIEGKTTGDEVEISVSKDGYYRSEDSFCLITRPGANKVKDGRWQPWGEHREIRLRKIRNPVLHGNQYKALRSPMTNVWIGVDLKVADWVRPFGCGERADFELRVRWDGLPPDRSKLCCYDLRVCGSNDGFYLSKKILESEYKEAFVADVRQSYTQRMLDYTYHRMILASPPKEFWADQEAIFRVRTELDDGGNVISANYGSVRCCKVSPGTRGRGALIEFCSVFNPTPNDPNLEDDEIAQRTYKQIELEKRLEKERREKEEKTVWGGIKKLFGSP